MSTIQVSRKSWYMRYLTWVYGLSANRASVCIIFWALLASPVYLAATGLVMGLAKLIGEDRIDRLIDKMEGWGERHPGLADKLGKAWMILVALFLGGYVIFALVELALVAWWIPVVIVAVCAGIIALAINHDSNLAQLLKRSILAFKSKTCPVIEVTN